MTALPAGSFPAATRPTPPLEAGGLAQAQQPKAPEPARVQQPSASVERCPHCEAGHPRLPDGMHVRVSEIGIQALGKCPRPEEVAFVRREDTVAWFREKVAAMRERVEAARRPMPMPVGEPPHEPGEDG